MKVSESNGTGTGSWKMVSVQGPRGHALSKPTAGRRENGGSLAEPPTMLSLINRWVLRLVPQGPEVPRGAVAGPLCGWETAVGER